MKKKFIINFLTHSSFKVGYGHLNRCKILANEFKKKKCAVKIYVLNTKTKLSKDLVSFIRKEKEMRHADLLIVDTYNFKSKYYKSLKNNFKNILIFDDFKFFTPKYIDGIINYQPNQKKYIVKPNVKYFLGSKYLFLRDEFYGNKKITNKNFIFLSFGSYDQQNQLKKYVEILASTFDEKIYFITKEKKKIYEKFKDKIKIISNPRKISNLMRSCKFAITSSGTIIYEMLKFKKKIISISFSKNQEDISKYLSKKKYVFYLGKYNQPKKILYKKLQNFKNTINIKKLNSFNIGKRNVKNLTNDIINWLYYKANKLKVYEKKFVQKEYDEASQNKHSHKRAKWGSNKTMLGRYSYIQKSLPFDKAINWLDIGCGDGSLQNEILKKNKLLHCTGVELSEKLYKLSEKRKLKNFKTINQDFMRLKFNNQKFDIITCHGVMAKTNFDLNKLLHKLLKISNKNCNVMLDFQNSNWYKFNDKNFPDPRLKWYNPSEIKKFIYKNKSFKISKFIGFLPTTRTEVPINKAICIFLKLKKIN